MGSPALQRRHLALKTHEDNGRHHDGKPQDEKGDDNDQRRIGQFKGRVDGVDHGNNGGERPEKGGDAFVDVGVVKNHPLHAVGKGNKEGDIKKDAQQYVALGLFHVVINPDSQGPTGPGSADHGIEALGFFGGQGVGIKRPAPVGQVAQTLADDAVGFQGGNARTDQGPHIARAQEFRGRQYRVGVHGVANAGGMRGVGI